MRHATRTTRIRPARATTQGPAQQRSRVTGLQRLADGAPGHVDARSLQDLADRSAPVRRLQRLQTAVGEPARRLRRASTETETPVQRMTAVATFQGQTPATFGHSRRKLAPIDRALGAYLNQKTVANIQTLATRLRAYLASSSNAARKTVVQSVLDRATRERRLLERIGPANAQLIDPLIAAVPAAEFSNFVYIAGLAQPAGAPHLAALIQEIGAANLGDHDLLTALWHARAGGFNHMPTIIRKAGGFASVGHVRALLARGGKTPADLVDLTTTTNGDAQSFARLAQEVPRFERQAAPAAIPAPVDQERITYNAALDNAVLTSLVPSLTAMVGHADTAHQHADDVSAPAPMLANLQNARNALHQIATNIAANNLGQVRQAIAQLKQRLAAVSNWAAGTQANTPDQAYIAFEFQQFEQRRQTAETLAGERPIDDVNVQHFLARHTARFFDFNDIKPDNTLWTTTWVGATEANLATEVVGVLQHLRGNQSWLRPQTPRQIDLGGVAPVTIATRTSANSHILGQFFPHQRTANGVYDHDAATMRAILKLL